MTLGVRSINARKAGKWELFECSVEVWPQERELNHNRERDLEEDCDCQESGGPRATSGRRVSMSSTNMTEIFGFIRRVPGQTFITKSNCQFLCGLKTFER
ncbi:hypothetical protein GLOIN_2v1785348 [Rhizophagus irregularis DAOM 181602=DAOM 197198]|nr:hypothetical protein GLOIN_2v1785348 [Rhizophagus irregularis DAOM 181602=DAOM 197198]